MDAILVYDAGCRVCALAKDIVKAFDVRQRIQAVPLQDARSVRILAGMDEAQRWDSFHVVLDGKAASRGDGIIWILGALPMGSGLPRLAAEMPVLRRASERVYSIFHGVRDALQCEV